MLAGRLTRFCHEIAPISFSRLPDPPVIAERAIARERARDSASALEAEGRLSGGSGAAIAPPVIAERAVARERTRDSESALEADGRLIGGSGGAIAPVVIMERAIARDLS